MRDIDFAFKIFPFLTVRGLAEIHLSTLISTVKKNT
jgi:hypothetical protein